MGKNTEFFKYDINLKGCNRGEVDKLLQNGHLKLFLILKSFLF